MTTKSIALIPLVAFALLGCMGKDIVTDPNGNPPNTPAACTGSELCRFENPADTSLLTVEQKDMARQILEFRPDSTEFGILILEAADLRADTLSIKLFSDLQPLAEASSITFSADSLRIIWHGMIRGFDDSRVTFVYMGGAFYSGWVEMDGTHYELIALGGSAIMVIPVRIVHPDECSPAMKPAVTALSCLP